MNKHTPGPWRVQAPLGLNSIQVVAPAGYICEIYKLYGKDEEALHTAELIAAAPNLLKALETCHDILLYDKKHNGGRAMRMAAAAITKAKGECP